MRVGLLPLLGFAPFNLPPPDMAGFFDSDLTTASACVGSSRSLEDSSFSAFDLILGLGFGRALEVEGVSEAESDTESSVFFAGFLAFFGFFSVSAAEGTCSDSETDSYEE